MGEALSAAGAVVSYVEVAGGHHPKAGQAVARGYHAVLRAAPGLFGALYAAPAARRTLKAVRSVYLGLGGARKLLAGVRREAADVVVCPQASVSAVFAGARARGELAVPVVLSEAVTPRTRFGPTRRPTCSWPPTRRPLPCCARGGRGRR